MRRIVIPRVKGHLTLFNSTCLLKHEVLTFFDEVFSLQLVVNWVVVVVVNIFLIRERARLSGSPTHTLKRHVSVYTILSEGNMSLVSARAALLYFETGIKAELRLRQV